MAAGDDGDGDGGGGVALLATFRGGATLDGGASS